MSSSVDEAPQSSMASNVSLIILMKSVSQTHCRPRPELDIDLIPAYLSPGNSEAGARPVG